MARSPAQDRAWRHNQMRGQAIRCRKSIDYLLVQIMDSDTATDIAKQLALDVRMGLLALTSQLRTRKDPP